MAWGGAGRCRGGGDDSRAALGEWVPELRRGPSNLVMGDRVLACVPSFLSWTHLRVGASLRPGVGLELLWGGQESVFVWGGSSVPKSPQLFCIGSTLWKHSRTELGQSEFFTSLFHPMEGSRTPGDNISQTRAGSKWQSQGSSHKMDLGLPRSNLGVRVSAKLVRLVAEILEPPDRDRKKPQRSRALLAAPPRPHQG